jgi:hypothetical protein
LADVSEARAASIVRVIIALVTKYAPPKRRYNSTRLHSYISQKAVIIILAAIRT